jgi:hypothetical protein
MTQRLAIVGDDAAVHGQREIPAVAGGTARWVRRGEN